METRKLLTFFLSFVAVVGFAFILDAQTSNTATTNTTTDNEYEKNYTQYDKAVSALEKDLITKETELDILIRGGVKDETELKKLSKEIGQLEGQLYDKRTEFRDKMRTLDKGKYGNDYYYKGEHMRGDRGHMRGNRGHRDGYCGGYRR